MSSEIRIISRDIKNREKDKKFEIFSSTMNCQCIYLGMHEQMTGACRSQKTKAEVHMKERKEEYKSEIIKMVTEVEDESVLRRIYLILITMLGADR